MRRGRFDHGDAFWLGVFAMALWVEFGQWMGFPC